MYSNQTTSNRSIQYGFTLCGLLICTCILALLLAVALPPFTELTGKVKIRRAVNDYVSALETARTTAITDHTYVTICRSADNTTCSGNWNEGAIVFADTDRDRIVDASDTIILVVNPHPATDISLRAFGNRQFLQFTPRGLLHYQSGNMTFCPLDNNVSIAKQLIVNSIGRVRQATDYDQDGIVENATGEAIECE